MKYAATITAFLATLVVANPVADPQSPAQTAQAESAIVSYYAALATDPALTSLAAQLTNPADLSTLQAFGASLQSDLLNGVTPAANFLDALPTPLHSFFGSVYTEEMQIMSSNGFTNVAFTASATTTGSSLTATGSSSPSTPSKSNASSQRNYVGASAGILAGLLGVVMAL